MRTQWTLAGLIVLLWLSGYQVESKASEHPPTVISVTERNYLDTYNFYNQIEIGGGGGEDDEPIFDTVVTPVSYRIADFVIQGEWSPGEIDSWGFNWGEWTLTWSLSEPEGVRHPLADVNPFFDFTYYGFDLQVSGPDYDLLSGGLGGFPDRFGLVDAGTVFEDSSGIFFDWANIPGLGEGPYFGSNLVETIGFLDTVELDPTGQPIVSGEGLLSFAVGFENDQLWTRIAIGERLGVIPEPTALQLFGVAMGFAVVWRWRKSRRVRH